ncbi:hypothetical protein L6452_36899 [Arctium lappa]|uniref:Uncharacterized protein n=1 Tax=Arctium lappa TaxID=4217 RepID=A0ACB8Y1Y2_ARCLA|nr:hypothetical protein L6452_36899 [Arctium lappa]
MGSNEKPVQLKVFIDKKKKKVMFAEAEDDLVDILFSCKDALLNPRNSSASDFQKLKVNLDDRNLVGAAVDDSDQGFVKKSSFIITDDLNVLPVLRNTSIILLNSLGLRNIDLMDERTMRFGVEEKSKMIVLCAEVENFFVELLFSFLTIPLGTVKLTMDNSSPVAISNLYDSITSLGDGNYLKSEDVKTMLLYPKLAANYQCGTEFWSIYELSTI